MAHERTGRQEEKQNVLREVQISMSAAGRKEVAEKRGWDRKEQSYRAVSHVLSLDLKLRAVTSQIVN